MRTPVHEAVPKIRRTSVMLLLKDERAPERTYFVVLKNKSRGDWELPGGGLGNTETTPEAAVRELAEETGIVVSTTTQVDSRIYYVDPRIATASGVIETSFHYVFVPLTTIKTSEEHTDALTIEYPAFTLNDPNYREKYRNYLTQLESKNLSIYEDAGVHKIVLGDMSSDTAITRLELSEVASNTLYVIAVGEFSDDLGSFSTIR